MEQYLSFGEYVREYELQRSEGLLLRYLSEIYKTLTQSVPELAKTEEVRAVEVYFESILRQIDSSLIDEWEKLKNPQWVAKAQAPMGAIPSAPIAQDITRNPGQFTVLVRNAVFRFIRALSTGDFEEALSLVSPGERVWTIPELEALAKQYAESHGRLCTDGKARAPAHMRIDSTYAEHAWLVEQTLIDPEEHNDWSVRFILDLKTSREENRPVLTLESIAAF